MISSWTDRGRTRHHQYCHAGHAPTAVATWPVLHPELLNWASQPKCNFLKHTRSTGPKLFLPRNVTLFNLINSYQAWPPKIADQQLDSLIIFSFHFSLPLLQPHPTLCYALVASILSNFLDHCPCFFFKRSPGAKLCFTQAILYGLRDQDFSLIPLSGSIAVLCTSVIHTISRTNFSLFESSALHCVNSFRLSRSPGPL